MACIRNNLSDPKDWEKIFDVFNDGIYITNSKGLTLNVNKAYESITGIPATSVIGKYMEDIVREGILSVSITRKVIESGNMVTMNQTINGGKEVVLRGVPIFDEDNNIEIVVTFVRDITVINQTQDELDKSRIIIDHYKNELSILKDKKDFVAQSKEFKKAISLARRVANVDSTVLILGESGTGKEIIARQIHERSHRAPHLFLKINCGAIPENLLEAELFGYEGGAFTGAKKNGHIGICEMANKGSVFLDEIGDMPLILQVKLLRVLQEKTITRIGSSKSIEIDTRIIAATNLNLEEMVAQKKFREDLYYRLNVVMIKTPSLRERKEEIPYLVDFFLSNLNKKYHMNKKITPAILKEFMDYNWPGNVRELENVVERILVTSDKEEIGTDTIDLYWKKKDPISSAMISDMMPLKDAFEMVERALILEAAKRYKTTYQIAEALKISQPSVSRKLNKYKVQ